MKNPPFLKQPQFQQSLRNCEHGLPNVFIFFSLLKGSSLKYDCLWAKDVRKIMKQNLYLADFKYLKYFVFLIRKGLLLCLHWNWVWLESTLCLKKTIKQLLKLIVFLVVFVDTIVFYSKGLIPIVQNFHHFYLNHGAILKLCYNINRAQYLCDCFIYFCFCWELLCIIVLMFLFLFAAQSHLCEIDGYRNRIHE